MRVAKRWTTGPEDQQDLHSQEKFTPWLVKDLSKSLVPPEGGPALSKRSDQVPVQPNSPHVLRLDSNLGIQVPCSPTSSKRKANCSHLLRVRERMWRHGSAASSASDRGAAAAICQCCHHDHPSGIWQHPQGASELSHPWASSAEPRPKVLHKNILKEKTPTAAHRRMKIDVQKQLQ